VDIYRNALKYTYIAVFTSIFLLLFLGCPPRPPAVAIALESNINIALLQMLAEGNDQEANLLKADAYCRNAAALGADIALFPEMFNIGYTGFRMVPEGTSEAWQAQAVQLTDYFVTHFQNLAKELDMAIALTCLEAWDSAPRNSLMLIDRHGDILYTYAKIHTTDFSSIEAVTTPGEEVYVAKLDTRKGEVAVGAMICYDREFPETARMLMLKGAEIILTPNACKLDDVRLNQFQARAFENALAVFMTNYPAPQQNGRSVAYGPGGEELALADDSEGIIIAGIDLEALRNTRKKTIWGDAFRRPHRYNALSEDLLEPIWERQDAFGNPYNRMDR